jgi:uncharacterized SAM-binding protein YcdF (DUF218 family)
MSFLLACGTCGYWIVWSFFPPVTFWVLVFAGWFLALAVVRSSGQAEIPGAMRLPSALLALGITALLSVMAGGPFVAAWLPLACLAGVAGLFRPRPWREARPWARPAVCWISGFALLLLAATAVFETRRAARLTPAQRVLLTESTPVAGAELKKITDCASLQEVIRGAVSDPKLVEKAIVRAREVCEPSGLDRFLDAEIARARQAGGKGEWKAGVLERAQAAR